MPIRFIQLVLSATLSFDASAYQIDWSEIDVGSNVKVYAGRVEGLDLVAFKGVDILHHSMTDIISVLSDIEKADQWINGMVEADIVEILGPTTRIDYNRQHLPWSLNDRDFVFKITTRLSDDRQQIIFDLASVEHEQKPIRPNIVRGHLLKSYLKLRALAANKTALEIMMLADPKGALPVWLVNLVNRQWAPNTINGLRNYLKQHYRPEINTVDYR
ncbi:START domain-containing protein [Methylomarinum vadi]|uniref:START domain-containing protein n=1 Tax=Methylomarinum vadi TaxID=438855 RepID=UPI0004DF08B2|nr:START domain-containing protein [Methylomarinum vadi]